MKKSIVKKSKKETDGVRLVEKIRFTIEINSDRLGSMGYAQTYKDIMSARKAYASCKRKGSKSFEHEMSDVCLHNRSDRDVVLYIVDDDGWDALHLNEFDVGTARIVSVKRNMPGGHWKELDPSVVQKAVKDFIVEPKVAGF